MEIIQYKCDHCKRLINKSQINGLYCHDCNNNEIYHRRCTKIVAGVRYCMSDGAKHADHAIVLAYLQKVCRELKLDGVSVDVSNLWSDNRIKLSIAYSKDKKVNFKILAHYDETSNHIKIENSRECDALRIKIHHHTELIKTLRQFCVDFMKRELQSTLREERSVVALKKYQQRMLARLEKQMEDKC